MLVTGRYWLLYEMSELLESAPSMVEPYVRSSTAVCPESTPEPPRQAAASSMTKDGRNFMRTCGVSIWERRRSKVVSAYVLVRSCVVSLVIGSGSLGLSCVNSGLAPSHVI